MSSTKLEDQPPLSSTSHSPSNKSLVSGSLSPNRISQQLGPAIDRQVDRESITLSSELHSLDNDSSSRPFTTTSDSHSMRASFSTRTIAPTARSSNPLKDFTIDKLNFRFRTLYGRDEEIARLRKCLQDAESSQHCRQFVLIRGYSGVGKTALAETLRRPVVKNGGVFAKGKFDLNQRNKPYQGIATACEELCSRLAALRYDNFELYRRGCEEIRRSLGTELELMEKAVPLLADLIQLHPTDKGTGTCIATLVDQSEQDFSSAEAKNRLIYAFQRLVAAFATTFETVVMVIDDVQWADAASLDLLQSMVVVADSATNNLVLVGVYRSNEVNDTHALAKMIRECRVKSMDSHCFSMTEINVDNLEVAAVHSLVQHVLGSTDASTLQLADLCHKKTCGNVFFLLQYLLLLKERCLVTFNFGSLRWEWDEADIELRTEATENVVDLLQSKMNDLHENHKNALQLAACFGNKFSPYTFSIAWHEIVASRDNDATQSCPPQETPARDDGMADDILKDLVALGFLEQLHSSDYKFTHDKIQEASSLLAPVDQRHELCRQVGTILVSKLQPHELDSAIALIVDLLNEGDPPQEAGRRIELACLNCRACQKSMSIAGFDAAARYAAYGIGLLDNTRWTSHRDLTLDLYSLGTAAEGLLGNVKTMEVYYNEVIAQKHVPLQEKLRVYNAYCSSVAGQGRPRDAAELAMQVLARLQIHFPRSKGGFVCQVVKHFLWVKRLVKSGKLSALETLPVDNDPLRQTIADFMDKLSLFCYLCGDELFLIVNFLALRRTFQYGLNARSSMGMSGVGMAMAALGEYQAAAILGRCAVKLSENSLPILHCRALLCVHGFCLHFTEPLRQSAKPLVRAYELGLRSGGTDNACYSILTYEKVCLITSHNYKMMAEDLKVYSRQAKDLKQEFPGRFLLLYLEYCENMLGESETDGFSLHGTRISYEEVEEWKKADKTFQQVFVILQGIMYTIYGHHDKGASLALREGTNILMKTFPGSPLAYYDILAKGLSCFATARKTQQRKYLRVAKALHRRVKQWTAKGNPNVNHFDALFEAELAAFQRKTFTAISKFETAVLLAARSGLLVDAALCSERLAEFLLEQNNRQDDAKFRFEQAMSFYKEVGAFRKARMLAQEQAALWPPPTGVLAIME